MHPLRILAVIVCLLPTIAQCQVVDPSFNSPLPFTKPSVMCVKVLPDGKILMGGVFDMYGNQMRQTLVKLNADGSLDNSFYYPDGGYRQGIYRIELKENGQLVVDDGRFVKILEANGAVATVLQSVDYYEIISATKVLADGKILVAGYGFSIGSFFRRHNADGTIDDTFSYPLQLTVRNIAPQDDGKLIISDSWGMIMRVFANGEIDHAFNPGPFNSYQNVRSLDGIELQPDGKIVRFLNYSGAYPSPNEVNMIRHDGSAETEEVITGVHGAVVGIRFLNSKIYVQEITGTSLGIRRDSKIIRLNADGTPDESFQAVACTYETDAINFDVATDGSVIVANSDFDNHSGINRYDVSGNFVPSFDPELLRFGYYKTIRKAQDNSLLVSGNFYRIGDHVTTHVGKLLSNGSPDQSFAVTIDNGESFAAELAGDGGVIVSAQRDVFKVDATGSVDPGFQLERTSDLSQITEMKVLQDGRIVMAGYNNLYRVLANGQLDPSFASGNGAGGPNGAVHFLVQPDGKIVASGATDWNGEPTPRLARINVDGSLDHSFAIGTGPDENAYTFHVMPIGEGIFLGSYMQSFNGRPVTTSGLKINSDGLVDEAFMTNFEALDFTEIFNFRSDVEGFFRTTLAFDTDHYVFDIDRINENGTRDAEFNLPENLVVSFSEDILADENSIWIAGENTQNGLPVFLTKLLRSNSSISIVGTTLQEVAEDTPFQLHAEDIIIDGLVDTNVNELKLLIEDTDHYNVSGNTITPNENFNGSLIIPVTITKNSQPLASGELSITITPVNDKPVIIAANIEIQEDVLTLISLDNITFTDVDTQSADVTVQVIAGTNCSVSGNSILANANYNGPIDITIVLNDGNDTSDQFTFSAQVTPVNDAPTILAAAPNQKCSKSSPLILTASKFEISDVDNTDGFSITAIPGQGYDIVDGAIVPHSSKQQKLMVSVAASDGASTGAAFAFEIHVLPAKEPNNNEGVWPNPATNVINHSFSDAVVTVKNLSGKVVAKDEHGYGSIDISHLKPGMYVVEVSDGFKVNEQYRFVKK